MFDRFAKSLVTKVVKMLSADGSGDGAGELEVSGRHHQSGGSGKMHVPAALSLTRTAGCACST